MLAADGSDITSQALFLSTVSRFSLKVTISPRAPPDELSPDHTAQS